MFSAQDAAVVPSVFHPLCDTIAVSKMQGFWCAPRPISFRKTGSLSLRPPAPMCTKSGVTTGGHRNCRADRCLESSCKQVFPGRDPVTW